MENKTIIDKLHYVFFNKANLIYIYHLLFRKNNRDPNTWIFGSPQSNNYFFGNTKYLFLWINKYHPEINSIWITDKKKLINGMKKLGYKAVFKNSKESIKCQKKAGFLFTDIDLTFVDNSSIATAHKIQLWHGIPITKNVFTKSRFKYFFLKYIPSYTKCDYTIVSSFLYKKYFENGWPTKAIITGYPRTDILFNDYKFDNVYILSDNKKTYEKIINKREKYSKLVIYLPTYRDYNLNFDKILLDHVNLKKINIFLKRNNSLLLIKYHPRSDSPRIFKNKFSNILFLENNFDIQPLLKYSDMLITDYSSIYTDYLILNKPIIHFLFDSKTYIKNRNNLDYGMLENYKKNMIGYICKNENDLLSTLKKLFDGYDPLNKKRKKMRDLLFKYKDGKSCERIYKFIVSTLL